MPLDPNDERPGARLVPLDLARNPAGHVLGKLSSDPNDWGWIAQTGGGGGEANTASNQGAGTGVFKTKTGVDLEFNSLGVSGGLGISLASDVITIDFPDGAVTLPKITNADAWSLMGRNAASAGTPEWIDLSDLAEEPSPSSGDFLMGFDSTGRMRKMDVGNLPTGGSGEANTGSSVGGGVAVFSGKVGIDLQFHSLAASGGLAVSEAADLITINLPDGGVSLPKIADIATDSFLGRDTAGTGDVEVLTPTVARSILNVENNAAADQDADEVPYDNTTSGLTATDAQAAIDEVEGRLDLVETALTPIALNWVTKSPTADQVITAQSATVTPLWVGGATDQSDDLVRIQSGGGSQTGFSLCIKNNGGTDVFTVSNTGVVTLASTIDGRDLAVDGAKLDGIEASAKDDQDAEDVPINNAILFEPLVGVTDVRDALNQLARFKVNTQGNSTTEIVSQAVGVTPLKLTGASGQTAEIFQVNVNGPTEVLAIESDGSLTVTTDSLFTGEATFAGGAAETPARVAGAASQTANIFEVATNAADVLVVDSAGELVSSSDATFEEEVFFEKHVVPFALVRTVATTGLVDTRMFAGSYATNALPYVPDVNEDPIRIRWGYKGGTGSRTIRIRLVKNDTAAFIYTTSQTSSTSWQHWNETVSGFSLTSTDTLRVQVQVVSGGSETYESYAHVTLHQT